MTMNNSTISQIAFSIPAPVRVNQVQVGGGYRLPAPVRTPSVQVGGGYRLPEAVGKH